MEITLSDLPLVTFLERLRRALLLSIGVFAVSTLLCWFVTEPAIAFLFSMYSGVEELVYTHVAESFFVRLKLAAAMGFAVSVPWLLWQGGSVLTPFLRNTGRSFRLISIVFASVLFYVGLAFALLAVLPLALRFFLSFGGETVEPLIRLDSMVSFTISFSIPFALLFQLPVVVYFLARIGLLRAESLRKHWKYSVLVIFIVSAILTPADVFSQTMMAVPLLVLYEVSIVLARMANRAGERSVRGE